MGLIMVFLLTATFAWEAPATGVAPTGYLMYRQVGTQPWQRIGAIDAPQQGYTDPAAVKGKACYRVTSTAQSSESLPSNTVCITCKGKRCR